MGWEKNGRGIISLHVIYKTQLLTVVFALTHHQNEVPGNIIGSKKFGAQNYLRRKKQKMTNHTQRLIEIYQEE